MHNDIGSKKPVQSHEPNTIPWGNAYISINVHIQNLDHFIDAYSDVASSPVYSTEVWSVSHTHSISPECN